MFDLDPVGTGGCLLLGEKYKELQKSIIVELFNHKHTLSFLLYSELPSIISEIEKEN